MGCGGLVSASVADGRLVVARLGIKGLANVGALGGGWLGDGTVGGGGLTDDTFGNGWRGVD